MARTRSTQRSSTGGSVASRGEIGETLKAVTKRYGENSVHMADTVYQPDRISTGSFMMDYALLGGIPHNRCSMIVGERHAGKTMLASKIIASAQRQYPDQTPVFLDIEGTFDATWAGKLGVDIACLPVVGCETGEMAVDVGDALIGSMETSLLVVDSVAALTPMRELEGSAEDAHVGIQARLMGNFIRRLTAGLIKERKRGHYVTVLFLNQFRAKIGGFAGFGEPRSIPGGKALEFSTSVQIIIKNKENKGKDSNSVDTITHNDHPFTITKNKCNTGPRTGEFVLIREDDPATGLSAGDIDDAATVLAYAKKWGLYTGGGSRWTLEFGDTSYKFGKAAEGIRALQDDVDLYWSLRCFLIQMHAQQRGMPSDFIERIR